MLTLEAAREKEHRANKFMAALQGVDLDAEDKKASMDRVREEMQKIEEARGITPSSRKKNDEFADFGIAIVEEG